MPPGSRSNPVSTWAVDAAATPIGPLWKYVSPSFGPKSSPTKRRGEPRRAAGPGGHHGPGRTRTLHRGVTFTQDRFAGLLLLRYAHWPAAISRLTIDHIEETDGAARIHLDAAPAELPEPVADLAMQQIAVRRSHTVLAQTDSPWLSTRRPARPSDQCLGHGRTTPQTRHPPRGSPLDCTVPAFHRTARRRAGPHPRHRHHRRRHMAASRRPRQAAYAAEVSRRTSPQPPIHEPGAPT